MTGHMHMHVVNISYHCRQEDQTVAYARKRYAGASDGRASRLLCSAVAGKNYLDLCIINHLPRYYHSHPISTNQSIHPFIAKSSILPSLRPALLF